MSTAGPDPREPDGVEEAVAASGGEPRESGPEATREALASTAPYRLQEESLEERDARFSRPRKEQGPPLEGQSGEMSAEADTTTEQETVEETPPPEQPPEQ